MAGVYTQRLLGHQGPGDRSVVVVPAGQHWIVRCVDVAIGGTASTVVIVSILPLFPIFVLTATELATGPWHQWQGRQAVNAGEQLSAYTDGGDTIMITGYVF